MKLIPTSTHLLSTVTAGSENLEFGVHDSLRHGIRNVKTEIQGHHPLEAHLEKWDETRTQLKYEMLKRTFGAHAPIRLQMELALLNAAPKLIPVTKTNNLAMDILQGLDDQIEFEDYLGDRRTPLVSVNPHDAMEQMKGITL